MRIGRDVTSILEEFFLQGENCSNSLDLSQCNLSKLPPLLESLIDAQPEASARLTLLNLAHNSLSTLPSILTRLPNLRILFLLGNAFTDVPDVISKLPSLKMLSFKQCALSGELKASALPPTLTWLILTSNCLTGLSEDFPKRCPLVRKLMLSNNQIRNLPKTLSIHMQDLELLRLANNELSHIPMDMLKSRALKWLAMSGNEVTGGKVTRETLPINFDLGNIKTRFNVDWEHALGSGSSGTAYAAVDNVSGAKVVIKRFRDMEGSDGRTLDEIRVACGTQGITGLIQTLGFGVDEGGKLVLVLERMMSDPQALAQVPSFESCTRSVFGNSELRLSWHEKHIIVDCVRNTVNALHQRGICHGDVYAHNVLVSWKQGRVCDVKLGDLGAAWFVPEKVRPEIFDIEQRAVDVFREEVFGVKGK